MAAVPVTRSWHIRRPLHSFCATSPLFVFGLHSPRLSSRISLRRRSVQHDLSATAPAPASAAARNMPAHRNTPYGQTHCVHTCNPLSTVACRSCMPNDSAASLPHTAAARNDITTATTNGRTVNRPRNRILCLAASSQPPPLPAHKKQFFPAASGSGEESIVGRLPAACAATAASPGS